MNVMQLNTDIYHSLGVLSNAESYLEEALASINQAFTELKLCLLYTSDAADE